MDIANCPFYEKMCVITRKTNAMLFYLISRGVK